MKPQSSIETHPQRQMIIDAVLAGQTLRQIAKQTVPPVSTAAICRFKQAIARNTSHAIETAKLAIRNKDKGLQDDTELAVTRAAMLTAVDPFLTRIAQHQATTDAEIRAASGDGKTIAGLISTDYRGLELQAKLTGRLDAGSAVTVNVVCPGATPGTRRDAEDVVTIDIGPRA